MIKAIIFDFYGVIRGDEYHDWLTRHGLKANPNLKSTEFNIDLGQMTMDDFFKRLSKFSGIPAKNIQREFKQQSGLNKDLLALMLDLKKSYKIVLLSNASSPYLRETMEEAGIDKLFDEIIISSEVGLIKPAEEIFSLCLKKLGVKPEEAVFIDDNPRFVEVAKALGIEGIHYQGFELLLSSLEQIGIISR